MRGPARRERGEERRSRAADAPGRGHAKDDIPATLVREKMGHPEMSFSYGRALGIRPELLELMDERISAVVLEEKKEETAVLIVGRGSSDPDANSDLSKIARLFYEGRPYPVVESAYVSMTPPDVANGLDRCLKLGAKRIVVFSYFLYRRPRGTYPRQSSARRGEPRRRGALRRVLRA